LSRLSLSLCDEVEIWAMRLEHVAGYWFWVLSFGYDILQDRNVGWVIQC
jgi:hypothetical protein